MVDDYLQPYSESKIAVASLSLLDIPLGYMNLKMFP